MKHALKLFCCSLVILSSLAGLSACTSSGAHQESTGQYIDSSGITVKVKSDLLADESVKSLAISVSTYKGVVQLSGFVDTVAQKEKAVSIARRVDGVKGVVDALVVKSQ